MFKNKKLIIFDMDGTLIDSVGIWNEVDEKLILQIGDGTIDDVNIQVQRDQTLKRFKDGDIYLEYCRFLKEKYNSKLTAEEVLKLRKDIAADYMINVVEFKPDADKVIKRLKELGYKLAIGTTTRRWNLDRYNTDNKKMMEKCILNDWFDIILAKEDVEKRKPDPEVHLKILEALDIKKEEALVIEDSLIGVEAARNAGIECAIIYDKYSDSERDEINEKADYLFNCEYSLGQFIGAEYSYKFYKEFVSISYSFKNKKESGGLHSVARLNHAARTSMFLLIDNHV